MEAVFGPIIYPETFVNCQGPQNILSRCTILRKMEVLFGEVLKYVGGDEDWTNRGALLLR